MPQTSATSAEPWKMPEVHPGDDVMVRPQPTSTDAHYGKIVAVYPDSVDVRTFQERNPRMFADCLHRDDPRIIERPGMFEFDERGIFDFTEGEKRRREQSARMDAIEAMLEKLASQVAVLDARPKPGRPRKQQGTDAPFDAD